MLKSCKRCGLRKNQEPIYEKVSHADIFWVGISAKKCKNENDRCPLAESTNTGKIIKSIEDTCQNYKYYRTNLVKCVPLDKDRKIRYPTKSEINSCMVNLRYETKLLRPKLVVTLGKLVFYSLIRDHVKEYSINSFSYRTGKYDNIQILNIPHPSYIYIYKRSNLFEYINQVRLFIESLI